MANADIFVLSSYGNHHVRMYIGQTQETCRCFKMLEVWRDVVRVWGKECEARGWSWRCSTLKLIILVFMCFCVGGGGGIYINVRPTYSKIISRKKWQMRSISLVNSVLFLPPYSLMTPQHCSGIRDGGGRDAYWDFSRITFLGSDMQGKAVYETHNPVVIQSAGYQADGWIFNTYLIIGYWLTKIYQ